MVDPQRAPLAFTLRAHLLAFAAAVLLPVSVLTAALLFNSAQLERTQIEARLDQVVDDLAEDTDLYLSNLVSILQTLATSPALQAGDLEAFHGQASAAARNINTGNGGSGAQRRAGGLEEEAHKPTRTRPGSLQLQDFSWRCAPARPHAAAPRPPKAACRIFVTGCVTFSRMARIR